MLCKSYISLMVCAVSWLLQILRKPDGGSRGFGFVTYKDEMSVEKCLVMQHSLSGKTVELKRAVKKEDMSGGGGGMMGGMGGGGTGYGMGGGAGLYSCERLPCCFQYLCTAVDLLVSSSSAYLEPLCSTASLHI